MKLLRFTFSFQKRAPDALTSNQVLIPFTSKSKPPKINVTTCQKRYGEIQRRKLELMAFGILKDSIKKRLNNVQKLHFAGWLIGIQIGLQNPYIIGCSHIYNKNQAFGHCSLGVVWSSNLSLYLTFQPFLAS